MKHKGLIILSCVIAVIVFYLCLVCLPYVRQGGVSAETMQSFSLTDYFSDSTGQDRAAILFDNEEALAERVRLISHATERIILSTFDFKADNSGKIMLAALYDAANRGVEIQILIDGFPYLAHTLGNEYFKALGSLENATIKVYNPVNLLQPTKLMARLHDKYLIVDDSAYILGGRNTYDYFLGNDTDYKNYDWDILVYRTGDVSSSSLTQVENYFDSVWNQKDCKTVMSHVSTLSKAKTAKCREELDDLYLSLQTVHEDWFTAIDYETVTVETNQIRLISNPVHTGKKEPVLFYQMTELMKHANTTVSFHTPYIMCNDYMLERLSEIGSNVPSVVMMTNSVANNGNPFGATDYKLHKTDILDTGIQIIEYDSGVSYHGKCFTIDDRLSAVGSFNWDMRSAYLDTELMLVIDSTAFNEQLRNYMKIYEEEALVVADEDSYLLTAEQTPRELTSKKKRMLFLVGLIDWCLRFLM